MSKVDSNENEVQLTGIPTFTTPLYIQRYNLVTKIIEKYKKSSGKFSKIADFGCSNFGLFQFLKQIERVKEIVLIEISYEDLKVRNILIFFLS
ncbi:hypothetical protein Avbf_17599 [Armadillidium vulgare]|nr:hypothetical protein Avbf_17599 [Armadillidium vulgare]